MIKVLRWLRSVKVVKVTLQLLPLGLISATKLQHQNPEVNTPTSLKT